MFGTNDTTVTSNDDPAMLDNVKQPSSEPDVQVATPQPQYMSSSSDTPQPNPFVATLPQQSAPLNNSIVDEPQKPIAEPAQGFSSSPLPEPTTTPMQQAMNDPVTDSASSTSDENSTPDDTSSNDAPIAAASMQTIDTNHLAGMKQQALDHLEPLVNHLDQSPEEAFKTTMMMIQANDNHTLLEKALKEAKGIEDDKVRANAMLDIINEINYFSQLDQQ